MYTARVLYVEDDLSLAFVTIDNLEMRGYQVIHCQDGKTALTAFKAQQPDICVLDVMLPDLDGFTLAKAIRQLSVEIPIIFLTSKSQKEDKIYGLKLGADDYLTKPFSIEELDLKMQVFLKRSKVSLSSINEKQYVRLGSYLFDVDNLLLIHGEEKQSLTKREADLLALFCRHKGNVLKREDILREIWGTDDYFAGRSLDVFISRLRKYLKADERIAIENLHGIGFKLVLPNV
ncbi:MAG: response regulator transcription factor [Cytophagales bacterium]|nr:response regulator transcription factor [Bernardetiaceae bacterium]MDW8204707.1 response regulator transcription factor [Cytophagales bacterium]